MNKLRIRILGCMKQSNNMKWKHMQEKIGKRPPIKSFLIEATKNLSVNLELYELMRNICTW